MTRAADDPREIEADLRRLDQMPDDQRAAIARQRCDEIRATLREAATRANNTRKAAS